MVNVRKYRTLIILGLAQCFGQTAAPIMVLMGGIVGARLAPDPAYVTLPIALMIIGTATTTIPASLLMARIGRKAGFIIATCYAAIAAVVAAYAIREANFVLFCFAAFWVGSYSAFLQQFRFAVAESVPSEDVPRSLSILMLAGIVAAYIGPDVARRFSMMENLPDYMGSFLGLSGLLLCSLCVLMFYRNEAHETDEIKAPARPFLVVLRQPSLLLAITASVVGWSIMSLIMTATPVSMHEIDHHSLDDTTWVIQSHILAMYIPSLFSGVLISWFGATRIIQIGIGLMLGCTFLGYGQPELLHYWGALVLLGVGWNFLFVGGTTLLTQSYRNSERFKMQAFNDFLVFGLQAVAALGSGVLLANLGWNGVLILSLPWLLLLVAVLFIVHRQRKPAVT